MAAFASQPVKVEHILNLNDGKREMVDEPRATALLEAAMVGKDAQKITRVCLHNKSYSEEAAQVIAAKLKGLPAVSEVDFSDMIAGRPEDLALRVLGTICGGLEGRALSYIDLSDNAMGQKGINACRAILEGQPALTSLSMCNDGLSAAAMEAVRDILLANTPTGLRRLHFHNNMSGDGGAKALAEVLKHCPHLEDLRFSGTRAGKEGSVAVAQALAECPAAKSGVLLRLDLADNTFGEQGGEALAAMLRDQPGLQFLNLRDCALEDEGATLVAAALRRTAAGLEHLDLSGNDLTAACMGGVARCVASKPALTYLGLEEQELGSRGLKKLASGLKDLGVLEKVQLNSVEAGSSGIVAVVEVLAKKPKLACLELNGNGLTEEGLSRVRQLLEAEGKGDVLGDMDDNDEDFEEDDEDESEGEEEEEQEEEDGGSAQGAPPANEDDSQVDELAAAMGRVHVQ